LVYSALLFVFGVAMGVTFIWDIGGMATRLREQEIGKGGISTALFKRAPWMPRAFGVWAIVFGIGQLIYVYGLTHSYWH